MKKLLVALTALMAVGCTKGESHCTPKLERILARPAGLDKARATMRAACANGWDCAEAKALVHSLEACYSEIAE
jgi:hypothetical protein